MIKSILIFDKIKKNLFVIDFLDYGYQDVYYVMFYFKVYLIYLQDVQEFLIGIFVNFKEFDL